MKIEDVFEIAVRIEKKAIEFYSRLSEKAPTPGAREAFGFLAAEEEKHLGLFRAMLESVADYEPRIKYRGRYEAYLNDEAFQAISAFRDDNAALSAMETGEALDLAKKMESQSINFYLDLKEEIPEDQHKRIDEIIDQELYHIERLKAVADYL